MNRKAVFFIFLLSVFSPSIITGKTVFDENIVISMDIPPEWFFNSENRDYLGPVFNGITSQLKIVPEEDNRTVDEYWRSLQATLEPFLVSEKVLFHEKFLTKDRVAGERKVFKIKEDERVKALDITVFPSVSRKYICIARYDYESFYHINPDLKQFFSSLILETPKRFFYRDSGMSFKIPDKWGRDYKSIDGDWEFHSLLNKNEVLKITAENSHYTLTDYWESFISAHRLKYFSYSVISRSFRDVDIHKGLLIEARAIGNYKSSIQNLYLVKNGESIIVIQYDIPDDGTVLNSFEEILGNISFYN